MAKKPGKKKPKKQKKLPSSVKLALKADYLTGYFTDAELAKKYGMPRGTLNKIAVKEKWNIEKKTLEQNAAKSITNIVTSEIMSASAHRAKEMPARRKRYVDMIYKIDDAIAKKINEILKKKPVSLSALTESIEAHRSVQNEILRLHSTSKWISHGKADFAKCNTLDEISQWVTRYADEYMVNPMDSIRTKLRVVSKKAETDTRNKVHIEALQEYIDLTARTIEQFVPVDKRIEAGQEMMRNVKRIEKHLI